MNESTRSRLVAVAIAVLLAAVALGVGNGLVIAAVVALRFAGVSITPSLAVVLSTVLLQGVTFGGLAALYIKWRGRPASYGGFEWPSLKEVAIAVGGYVGMFVLLIALSLAVQSTGAPTSDNSVTELATGDPTVLLVLLPLSFLLIGPGEELLFRGIIQSELRDVFPAWAAIPVACLVFAAAHATSLVGSIAGTVVSIGLLFCVSLVFGVIYEYTRNLTVTAFIHGAYDATLFLALYAVMAMPDVATSGASALGFGF